MTKKNLKERFEVTFKSLELQKEEWTIVERHPLLWISNLGRIKIRKSHLDSVHCPFARVGRTKTTKGYYLSVNTLDVKKGRRALVGVHQLVARAFLDSPPDDGKTYEVNHIDGNKVNNRASNLEWTTRKRNVKHAYETGLNDFVVKIRRRDVKTGEVKEYLSANDIATQMDIPFHRVTRMIRLSKKAPYLGKYVFEMDLNHSKMAKRPWMREVVCKDYRTGKITVADTSRVLTEVTGVVNGTIDYRVRKKDMSLINGCVFTAFEDGVKVDWPEYSKEEVTLSVERYQNRKLSRTRDEKVWVKDYRSREVLEFSTCAAAGKWMKYSHSGNRLADAIRTRGRLVYGSCVVQLQNEYWPVIADDLVDWLNRNRDIPNAYLVRVYDRKRDVTEYYASGAVFARAVGQSVSAYWSYAASNRKMPFMDRWDVHQVHLYD